MTHELPAWHQIERWLQLRFGDVQRFALPPADPAAVAALERTIGRPLPTELRNWFGLHAGTTKELELVAIERTDYWPLLPPKAIAELWTELRQVEGWLPEWLPLALCSSGSVTFYLCCALLPPGADESGPLVILDLDDSSCGLEPYPSAASLNEYFMPLARTMERGGLVAVGYDDGADSPPELMTSGEFAAISPDHNAYTLPRTECKEEASCDQTDEGLRFLHLLTARGQLLLTSDADLAQLATGLGKLLQSPQQCDERAHALCEWLADQPEVEEIYATDHEVVDLLEVW